MGVWGYDHGHTYFFALSGFLIGYTTFKKMEAEKKFSLKTFLLNRILRTFPVYFLILFICGISFLLFKYFGHHISINDYWTYFVFLQNYFAGDALFILKNLWAMAVTEQLYLGWGLLVLLLQQRTRNYLPYLALCFTVLAFIVGQISSKIYENTLSYAGIFLGASCFARAYFQKNKIFRFIQNLKDVHVFSLLILLATCIIYGYYVLADANYLFKEHVMSLLFCGFLMVICYKKTGDFTFLSNRFMRYLGKLTYGLYCYHAIAITLVTQYNAQKQLGLNKSLMFLIVLVLTIMVSIVSFELYEKRFLKLKQYRY